VTHTPKIVLDGKDRRILQLVQRDSTTAQAEIARKVGLSTAAVNERLRKLRKGGVIKRFSAQVDPVSVGVTVTAFVEVFLEHPRFEPAFLGDVRNIDEVLECHHVTGEASLLLKVRARDMGALQRLLLHELGGHDGVRRTRTVMVLSTVKEETYIEPAPAGGDQ
jgi:Lrp/AsnC family transcriptional regulator, leucine-responsive regulatory protein